MDHEALDPLDPDHLLGLPPAVKIVLGLMLAAFGFGFIYLLSGGSVIIIGSIGFLGAIGLAMVFTGVGEARETAKRAAEVARVEREWDTISAEVARAIAEGKSLPRVLQGFGFSYPVRKMVQARLDAEHVGMPRLEDPVLGELAFDMNLGAFVGTRQIAGHNVQLLMEPDQNGDATRAIQRAATLAAEDTTPLERVRSFASEQLLPRKNSQFLKPDEQPLSPESLGQKLRFEGLRVRASGAAEFHFDAGSTFGHYAVCATLSPDDACERVDFTELPD